MKKIGLIFVFFLFVLKITAQSDISSELSYYYATDYKKENAYKTDLKFDLIYNKAIDDTEVKAILRYEKDTNNLSYPERIYINEAYISQDIFFDSLINSLNLKIGKIIYSWGNADELRPVDILNPQDLTFLLFKPLQERKFGILSGSLTLFITDNIFIQGVSFLEFKGNEFDSKTFKLSQIKDIEENPVNQISQIENPDTDNLFKQNFALRVGVSPFDIDMHFIYYKGYDHNPTYESKLIYYNPLTNPPMAINIIPEYKEIQMCGFDFQRSLFSGIAVRGEIAYFLNGKFFNLNEDAAKIDILQNGNGLLEKKYIEYTAGFDIVDFLIQDLYFNFEINGAHIIDYDKDIESDENVNSIISTLEYTFLRKKIRTRIKGFYNINDKAYSIGTDIGYKISDNYEIEAGGWILDGDKDTFYGQFRDKDFIYVQGKAIF